MESKNFKSFRSLMAEIDSVDRQQRDRGTLFEVMVTAYLENEPKYTRLFDKVWMLSDVPDEYKVPKRDDGVDLVGRLRDSDELVAIQCKFYSEDTKIYKRHIDSFLSQLNKKYYTEGMIVTSTDDWSPDADQALLNLSKTVSRIGLAELSESLIDWSDWSFENSEEVALQEKKTPRPHQIPAIDAVIEGFESTDRGKLIMAPGTGKTYTSMAIAERMADKKKGDVFRVLYLVPSIQLLSQTLKGWTQDTNYTMDSIAVCSDRKVTKKEAEEGQVDIASIDIGYPATTNTAKLMEYYKRIENDPNKGDFLTVFSTYQSIDVIIEAQKQGFYDFDLIVCDEAHRTTGSVALGEANTSFTKVHSNENIRGANRLYQTATPRVYGDNVKQKADENSIVLYEMSNTDLFGEEFYRLGFGQAIRQGVLTDYKVMVLGVDEGVISSQFQKFLAREDELKFDDVTKIVGCWNGLVKRRGNSDESLGAPMKRAIAFTGTIRESKLITDMFDSVVNEYLANSAGEDYFNVEIDHADGSMNALQKTKKINWLKNEVPDRTCRILSNARFLTEGVDVPELDAVMFLKPRKSKIDIAQAVGRVMRKTAEKDYGYVILPIGVPAGVEAEHVLDNNENYRVVWDVLNALRSLDERFDATINKLELNKKKPSQIEVIGVGGAPSNVEKLIDGGNKTAEQLSFLEEEEFSDLEKFVYGKIVKRVGNVRYWENWSEDVARIATQHIQRIQGILEDKDSDAYHAFNGFLNSLRHNINEQISENQAIEMLAQHMITKPVFEALFETYSFISSNPVSRAMNNIISYLDEQGLAREQEGLKDFYESVKIRAEGIDNLQAKQDIIVQLYDRFFRVGFKDTTERLGIVFTPTEVVDFIIHSVNHILHKHFGCSISDEGVDILDPFTGTGTFITRLLQSGLIKPEDMLRKYTKELHANEIVLLSYYIAAVNIEETFYELTKTVEDKYVPFEGIVLTDTFESTEKEDTLDDEYFSDNDKRLKRQKSRQITAIVGNPPYSAKQQSDNDNNQGKSYPILDRKISNTYSKNSSARNKANLNDSYIRAIRWSSDRIKEDGVVAFITNGSFMDATSTDGLRKCLYEEFNDIYVYNLRGFLRGKVGEASKIEGENIFDILQGVAIIILVRDSSKGDEHTLHYRDIGDYLKRKEKFAILAKEASIEGTPFEEIVPNDKNDWINQRDSDFDSLTLLGSKDNIPDRVFIEYSGGLKTGRDSWSYSYSKKDLSGKIDSMIDYFNKNINIGKSSVELTNDKKIKWTSTLRTQFDRREKIDFSEDNIYLGMYRPFAKRYVYFAPELVDRKYKLPLIYPTNSSDNLTICFSNKTGGRDFSCLVTDVIPDVNLFAGGAQCMPLKLYSTDGGLFGDSMVTGTSITSNLKAKFKEISSDFDDETIFAYVYGILHSREYRTKYFQELSKELPRIPLVKNYKPFVEVGKQLMQMHLHYEDLPLYSGVEIKSSANASYKVSTLKFVKKKNEEGKSVNDLTKIKFNKDITISNIPLRAYDYVINGRSAIHWIIDQYRVNTDKDTGFVSDPNSYSEDKYIFTLLQKIITLSVKTLDIMDSIPKMER